MGRKLDRRDFLKSLLTTGSVAWLVGGRGLTGGALGSVFTTPVPFIQDPSCSGGAGDPGLLDRSYFQIDPSIAPASVFTQSVASGDPKPNGIVLWTRVDAQSSHFDPQSPVAYQISLDETFTQVIAEGLACVGAEKDYTIKLPLAHTALRPFTTYYYRFIYKGCASRTGRFKTLPAEEDANPGGVRFGFTSCQSYSRGYYNAFRFLAQESVDFVVHLGDYIYETSSKATREIAYPNFPSGSTAASCLDDFRYLYKAYRSDPDLQAAHEKFAFIQIWDDHEFSNDSYREHSETGATPTDVVSGAPLRQSANQAWSEYGLADVAFDPAKGALDSIKAYRSIRFGNLMELFITDERLYRDGPVCSSIKMTSRCAAATSSTRTMLSPGQRDWFINGVKGSRSTWKVWANEVMLMQMKYSGLFVNLDQWDGYPAERAHILNSFNSAGVKNLLAITGDIHSFGAGYLKPNFDSSTSPRVGVEFVTGSITSGNMRENGVGWMASSMASSNSGHMVYFNSSTHGYSILELKPLEAICTMKAVSTITSTSATLSTLKTFKVPKDKVSITAV